MQMLEIETKAWVNDMGELEQQVAARGRLVRRYHKKDVYFRPISGPQVRVRSETDGSGTVTRKYKEIRDGVETSREDEFTVDRPELAERLLQDLGAEEYIRKEKIGSAYEVDGLTVELSEVVGLGQFIEIEWVGPDEGPGTAEAARGKVVSLAAALGIGPERFEARPYTQLLLERRGSFG
ncbi:class IV adenylate cyclase [Spirochaeta africana]|uniref:Adenylyl cyclase CyaB, putative n=1 Tax=Spirochaeta africana (strain ATCC 700263 / DSM 8902 / Z-7692) TaxID=889378 RepID=H9UHL4_SPIAZ|nr:class IV adenylate cyclase [Spirochaeta africana]AFG37007.1 adenylyl cyclase CyaB, putative [Spirochaeta africana DSM 8902]